MQACGYQEVIIQHWLWNKCQALLTTQQMQLLWSMLLERCKINTERPNVLYVQVMENHGLRSGASLPHPHSQILALPFIPPAQKVRLEIAKKWYDTNHQQNIFDQVIKGAQSDHRVLVETEHTIAFIPYAVNRSYETWIVSKTSPDMANELYMDEMSNTIRQVLLAMYHLKNDPDYNSIVRQAVPLSNEPNETATSEWYRWHVVVTPHGKNSTWAGIKGYGDFVPITGTPEEHVQHLRAHLSMVVPTPTSPDRSSSEGSGGGGGGGGDMYVRRRRLLLSGIAVAAIAVGVSSTFCGGRKS